MKTRSKSGFTLVEILIVVVILGILAAIVIPQFSQASTEARESSVKSNLQMLRSQIELYKIQHGDTPPDATSEATFKTCMLNETNVYGNTTIAVGQTSYGPYMQKWPVNAVTDSDVLTIGAGAPAAGNISTAGTPTGWFYDPDAETVYTTHDVGGLVGDAVTGEVQW